MSVGQYGTGHEFITVIDSTGLETVVPVRKGSKQPVARQPLAATTQVVTIGDNSRRQDLRTPQVIFTEQSGGMGEFMYTETEGILTFTDSQCDTRFLSEIVLPPATTIRGSITGLALSATAIVEQISATPTMFLYQPQVIGSPPGYFWNGTAWVSPTGLGTSNNINGFVRFNGYYVVGTLNGIFVSTNATAWTVGITSISFGIAVHDQKLYTISNLGVLQWNTNPTATSGYSTGATLLLMPNESVMQLFEWRDKSGRAALYCLTTARIMWYDEDADQWSLFYDFSDYISQSAYPRAHVWRRDGNLYLIFGQGVSTLTSDTVMWFSGTTNKTGPNHLGGLPTTSRVALTYLVGGANWLYLWGRYRSGVASPGHGRTMAMNDQQGWHTLYSDYNPSGSYSVIGGGYGQGRLWTVMSTGSVIEQMVPDNTDLPLFAPDRTYANDGTYYHEYAYTDGGTTNMDKQALWITIEARNVANANRTQGLPANTTIVAHYMCDTDTGGWTLIGTLTSSSTFPAVLPINGSFGVKFKQIKIRIGLTTSNSAASPIVTSVALAFARRPVQRYAYQVTVDLTDAAFGQVPVAPGPGGLNAAAIRARLEGYTQPGQLVKLRYGGNTTTDTVPHGTTVGPCQLTLGGAEGATFGPGQYALTFTDLSAPASG